MLTWQTLLNVVFTLLSGAVIPVWLYTKRTRENHFHDLHDAIQRVEEKLDVFIREHLRDHAGRG